MSKHGMKLKNICQDGTNTIVLEWFFFQTLVLITDVTFNHWQEDISIFEWQRGKKNPRVKYKVLQDEKERRGLGLLVKFLH